MTSPTYLTLKLTHIEMISPRLLSRDMFHSYITFDQNSLSDISLMHNNYLLKQNWEVGGENQPTFKIAHGLTWFWNPGLKDIKPQCKAQWKHWNIKTQCKAQWKALVCDSFFDSLYDSMIEVLTFFCRGSSPRQKSFLMWHKHIYTGIGYVGTNVSHIENVTFVLLYFYFHA